MVIYPNTFISYANERDSSPAIVDVNNSPCQRKSIAIRCPDKTSAIELHPADLSVDTSDGGWSVLRPRRQNKPQALVLIQCPCLPGDKQCRVEESTQLAPAPDGHCYVVH